MPTIINLLPNLAFTRILRHEPGLVGDLLDLEDEAFVRDEGAAVDGGWLTAVVAAGSAFGGFVEFGLGDGVVAQVFADGEAACGDERGNPKWRRVRRVRRVEGCIFVDDL